jgi:hypothetical protein
MLLAAACGGGQKDTALHLLGDIEATVIAASGEAAHYVPEQLATVQKRLADLKTDYAKQDYAAVLSGAPDVLGAAQALATAAAAKKDEMLKALNEDWAGLAVAVPSYVTALQDRITALGKPAAKKKPAAGIDLTAARAGMSDASSLWSKAQAAFAAGNLDEAVATAQAAKTKLQALATELKLQLPQAA